MMSVVLYMKNSVCDACLSVVLYMKNSVCDDVCDVCSVKHEEQCLWCLSAVLDM